MELQETLILKEETLELVRQNHKLVRDRVMTAICDEYQFLNRQDAERKAKEEGDQNARGEAQRKV